MKCEIAKKSEVIILQAIKHYDRQGSKTPVFTFISLYDDNEPYPLAELISVLERQIIALNKQPDCDSRTTLLITAENRLKRMRKICGGGRKQQEN
ncbi:hypothetical protein [Rodentibacter haemolyticus]|uniref:Uncharacterized protein n=1 Tax=Rodentibacter haemolyticus TaxID=2778911 RepID=A0ABX6UX50_9PAST|nr:hypothetical protein [Rodentibacter haemolyticus]QPB42668.1 hypothetical protein IHV77_00635 [Rodentibacter haemolyticus]